MALEFARHLEQRGQAGRLFYRQRRTRRTHSALLGVSAAASRRNGGRRQRLVAADRREFAIVLEEQSVPHQSLHGRRRFAAPAVGHDRSGRQSGYQRDQDRVGRSLRQALLRAVLDRGTRTFLRRHQQRRLADVSHGHYRGWQRRHSHVEADELENPGAVPPHLDDGIVKHLRHARR